MPKRSAKLTASTALPATPSAPAKRQTSSFTGPPPMMIFTFWRNPAAAKASTVALIPAKEVVIRADRPTSPAVPHSLHERLRRNVHPQVDHLEATGPQHGRHDVLPDVVDVPLDGTQDEFRPPPPDVAPQAGAYLFQTPGKDVRRHNQVGNKIFLVLVTLAHHLHAIAAFLNQFGRFISPFQALLQLPQEFRFLQFGQQFVQLGHLFRAARKAALYPPFAESR